MTEVLFHILGTIFYFIQGYFFYHALACLLVPRRQWYFKITAWFLGVISCTVVIFPNDITNITFNMPLLVVVLLVGYEGKTLAKLSLALLVFPIIIATNFLVMDIGTQFFFRFTSRSDILNTVMSNISILITVCFWFFSMKLLKKRSKRVMEVLDTRAWILLDIIGSASMAAVISCVYYTPAETYKVWLCMLACLVANIGSIRLVFYLAATIRSEMERKNLKLQRDYYEELEQNQLEIRKFRHDINNHFGVAANLLEEGSFEEAKQYFEKISGQVQAKGRVFCRNSVINAVLNAKYNRALELGTDCFFHIEIEALMFMEDLDICTILSNTLDNAIEACMQIEDPQKRWMSVKARCTENGYFSYEIRNAKCNKISMKNGKYETGKKDKAIHGIGLQNVEEAVSRYGGTLDIEYGDTEFGVIILVSADYHLD